MGDFAADARGVCRGYGHVLHHQHLGCSYEHKPRRSCLDGHRHDHRDDPSDGLRNCAPQHDHLHGCRDHHVRHVRGHLLPLLWLPPLWLGQREIQFPKPMHPQPSGI